MPRWLSVLLVLWLCGAAVLLWRIHQQTSARLTVDDLRGVVDRATDKVNLKIENHWSQNKMLVNKWKSRGEEVEIHTFQREGETDEAFEARHEAMVEIRKKRYPPD